MNRLSKSALEVQFDLRPAKQVERRILLDAFQRLAEAGFSIRNYRYTGFGALHFIDFVLFHKLLGIDEMLSVEHDLTLEGRVRFNCPFDSIEIVMSSSTDVIPTLSPDRQHILWLDYDEPVTKENLNDVYLAGSQLSSGSFVIVTVDVEPPVKDRYDAYTNKGYFDEEAGKYLGLLHIRQFTKENLHKPSRHAILNALREGMAGRTGIDFHHLFYFLYKDGHKMMTLGGMIGSKAEKSKLGSMNKEGAPYLRMTDKEDPYEIRVPVFTRKEKYLLDSAMPCAVGWQPTDFAIPAEHIAIYREIYRFLPSYVEILL